MNMTLIFGTDVGVTFVAALLVVRYLRPYLRKILIDLCGNEERAAFWTAFSIVTLVLVPTVFAMHYHPKIDRGGSIVFEVGSQIEWGLIGLIASVVTLGIVISRFIPIGPSRHDSGR